MDQKIKDFQTLVEKSSKILVFFPEVINADVAASVGLTYKLLTEKYSKNVELAASRDIPTRFKEILTACGVDQSKIIKQIKPVSYVIKVKDINDNIKVDWEKKDDSIEVTLIPEKIEIDFSKISFAKEGGYDLFITIHAIRLEDLGAIYTNSKSQFNRTNLTSIDFQSPNADYAKVSLHDENHSTVSELVYRLYKGLQLEPSQQEAEIMAEGILGSTYSLHNIRTPKTLEVISQLANGYTVDVPSITKKYHYSLSKQDLKLRERILRNVKFFDSKKLIYSTLSAQDFTETGSKPSDLDGVDYLPFNVCKEYEIAFLVYENSGKSYALIHSNVESNAIPDLLKKTGGFGGKYYGIYYAEGSVDAVANTVINGLGGNISSSSTSSSNGSSSSSASGPSYSSESNTPASSTGSQGSSPFASSSNASASAVAPSSTNSSGPYIQTNSSGAQNSPVTQTGSNEGSTSGSQSSQPTTSSNPSQNNNSNYVANGSVASTNSPFTKAPSDTASVNSSSGGYKPFEKAGK